MKTEENTKVIPEKDNSEKNTTVSLDRRRDVSKNPLCLSGKGVTRVFHTGKVTTVAVDHVDFEFHKGELISIVGESGSGKTTLSKMLLGGIPVIGNIPLLQIGLPAILSLYFDVFSGLMHAFIFAMLTMMHVAGAFPQEAWEKRQAKKAIRRQRADMARAEA